MFHHDTKPRRHRRVIDESGRELDDSGILARIRFAAGFRSEPEAPAMHRPYATSPTDLQGVARMPFAELTAGMRKPSAPAPQQQVAREPLTPQQRVQQGFAAMGRQVDEFVKVMSGGWRKLAAENDSRRAAMDARLAAWSARVHASALAAAYAEGGTQQVLALTPSVLAEMDAHAKAMAA